LRKKADIYYKKSSLIPNINFYPTKAHESPPKKTCKLELVPLSSEQSADSISTHQQEMLCELPTMVAAVPSKSPNLT